MSCHVMPYHHSIHPVIAFVNYTSLSSNNCCLLALSALHLQMHRSKVQTNVNHRLHLIPCPLTPLRSFITSSINPAIPFPDEARQSKAMQYSAMQYNAMHEITCQACSHSRRTDKIPTPQRLGSLCYDTCASCYA